MGPNCQSRRDRGPRQAEASWQIGQPARERMQANDAGSERVMKPGRDGMLRDERAVCSRRWVWMDELKARRRPDPRGPPVPPLYPCQSPLPVTPVSRQGRSGNHIIQHMERTNPSLVCHLSQRARARPRGGWDRIRVQTGTGSPVSPGLTHSSQARLLGVRPTPNLALG